MINIIQNTIGALGRTLGIVRKNLQLWLDFNKSEVIGSELVVNGDFATDLSGWNFAGTDATNTITWNNGRVEMIADGSTALKLAQSIFEVGKTYEIEFDAYNITGAGFKVFDGGTILTVQSDGHYKFYHTALSSPFNVYRNTASQASSGEFDNISVKEVTQFVKDKSPNTNNAKLFTGKALTFNGNDVVEVTDNGNINLGTSDFTFAFWINKLGSGGSTQRVIDKRNTKGYTLYLDNVNVLRLELNDGSGNVGFVMGTLTDDTFQRVVISADRDGNATCYINNSPQTPIDISSKQLSLNDSTNLFIGADAPLGSGLFFSGILSDLQLYNKAWTASDVAFDYNNPNHLAIDNPDTDLVVTDLKAYWAMSEGDGLVAYDSSGEGNNGTINGATYTPAQDTIPQLGMMDWAKGSNLIPYSEEFSNAIWNNQSIGTIPTLTSGFSNPNGVNNAYKISNANQDSFWYVLNGAGASDSRAIYARTVSGTGTAQLLSHNSNSNNTFNLTETWQRFEVNSTTSTTGNVNFYAVDFRGSGTLTELLIWGAQVNESSSVGNYILTGGAAAIDVTTIQNPTNKGYDILGNALRLREHAFNLDGSGYAEVADDATLNISNGTLQFWLKTSDTKFNILSGQSTSEFIGTTDNSIWSFGSAGTITSYIGAATANTQPLYDGNWSFYTFTGVDLSTWTAIETSNLAGFELDGLLDEVMIYSSVLTIKEIKNNYNIGINKHKASSSFSDDFSSDYGI
jgi:hypothetical protein